MNWSTPTIDGGGDLTYQWAFTSGSGASGSTGGTSAQTTNNGVGTYQFEVRACTPANNGQLNCGTWAQPPVAQVTAPQPILAVSKGGTPPASSGDCHSYDTDCEFIDVTGSHFPANSTVTVAYDTDHAGYGQFVTGTYTTDASGSFSASDAYFSYGGYHVWATVGSVTSNTITW